MKRNYSKSLLLTGILLLFNLWTYGQDAQLHGRVTDSQGAGVGGARVEIRDSEITTSTDTSGRYNLTDISPGLIEISVHSPGYKSQTKTIRLISSSIVQVNFMLEGGGSGLSREPGYQAGNAEDTNKTGAVQYIPFGDFQHTRVSTPEGLIAGKAAGLAVSTLGGAPGAASSLRIRGGNSLFSTNMPLIVLDGMPLSIQGITGFPGVLSLVNPDDIESFTLLKDASATALYGARGASGVILLKSKQGRPGKTTINFNTQYSIGKVPGFNEVFSPGDFRSFVQNTGPLGAAGLLGEADNDWQQAIYRSAGTSDNNLSISGSSKHMPYRISLGYLNQNGVLKTDALTRTSLGLQLDPSLLDDHLKMQIQLRAAQSTRDLANTDAIENALIFDPTQAIESGTNRFGGYFQWTDPSDPSRLIPGAPKNPLAILNMQDHQLKSQRSIGHIQMDYAFYALPRLHAKLNLGYDIGKGSASHDIAADAALQYPGLPGSYEQRYTNSLAAFSLLYASELPDQQSHLSMEAGYSYESFKRENSWSASPDAGINPAEEATLSNQLASFFGLIQYTYKDRYILRGSFRTDGYSEFSGEHKWAGFPAVGVAWDMKKEAFLSDDPILSDLKLRFGFGISGQLQGPTRQEQLPYDPIHTFSSLGKQVNDYNRGWERTTGGNLGLDFGLWKGRLQGSLDVYYNKTSDLLNYMFAPVQPQFTQAIITHSGTMESKGVELQVLGTLIQKEHLSWNVQANIAYSQHDITRLNALSSEAYPGTLFQTVQGGAFPGILIQTQDYPRNAFWVYQQVYDREGNPIEGAFVDQDDNDQLDAGDRHHYESMDPKMLIGLGSHINYQRWSAGFTARAHIGNYVYNNVFAATGNARHIFNPAASLSNGVTDILHSGFSGSSPAGLLSDYYVENGSFLRMDNLYLAYHAGPVFGHTGDLTLRASIQNAFLLTKYKGVDPEIPWGVDRYMYPRPRYYTLGVNLNF